ncbi:uncharacterized protein LOC119728749 isoform X2 [Patiria miniata]|nr:uncharacterized protein LOC119728749 isoform X2 [Patiria miniata]
MICDPCETHGYGVQWKQELGTWEKSKLSGIGFEVKDNEITVGRYILNWDMSFSIYDVEPGDTGRYRCSKKDEIFSWHEVIVYDPSEFLVVDTRENQRPLDYPMNIETRWTDWGPCTQCDEPGTRERIGFCYLGESPLTEYHNGMPCDYLFDWVGDLTGDTRHQRMIEHCSVTCREADRLRRHKKVQPYFHPFKCMLEIEFHHIKMLVVYEGDTLRMKCHYCAELYGGVKWYRVDPHDPRSFRMMHFDWHDNDDENKFVLNYDMSMEIRQAEMSDDDRYGCAGKNGTHAEYTVVVKKRPTEMHVVDMTKNQKPYSQLRDNTYLLYTMWMEWGPCSSPCGKPGTHIRLGHCYSIAPQVTGRLGKVFPTGIPCHYKTPENFDWSIIKSPLLDEKMIDTCNESCINNVVNVFDSDVQRYAAARRPGQKNPWARPKGKPVDRVELKVFGTIGRNVSLVCPGASEYATTEWKNGSRMMAPQQQEEGARGRVHFDDLEGSLQIANVTLWDEQMYRCYSNGVQAATIRLVVMKPLLDIQAFKSSFFQLGNVLQFYTAIFVFVIFMKCLARCIQNVHYKRSLKSRR